MAAARKVASKINPTKAGPLLRLVGGLDMKGKGTNHPVLEVDPVVLCDSATIQGKHLPPFGYHPHFGLIAVTTVVEGAFLDGDNLNGMSSETNDAGDVYVVSAGKGVCHEEKTAIDGQHIAIQTIFKIPKDKLEEFPVPELIKVKEADIPVLKLEGGQVRINVGTLNNVQSPAKVATLPRVVMLRVKVEAGKTLNVPLDDDLEHGFALVLYGACTLDGNELVPGGDALIFGAGETLVLENKQDQVADLLVVAGKKLNEPWVKCLCRNGFMVAPNEETALKVEAAMEEHKDDFCYKHISF